MPRPPMATNGFRTPTQTFGLYRGNPFRLIRQMLSNPSLHDGDFAVVRDDWSGRWLRFSNPVQVICVHAASEVGAALGAVERAVGRDGLHAVGWIGYEAAPAFDPALCVRAPGQMPVLWFGLYRPPEFVDLPSPTLFQPVDWHTELAAGDYRRCFDRIKSHVREGNSYQVNFTYRLRCNEFSADPCNTFLALVVAQRPQFGAFVSTGPWRICSASPELFFRLDGHRVFSRPMKGTAPRGLFPQQDQGRAQWLLSSEKNRAENLMIVDMVRNDFGRIALPGSVRANSLCAIEKYPAAWQMTSTVSADTHATVAEIFSATFPPASITGAPKAKTMEIIAELESSPRQVYTGAVGFVFPGRRAQFNVAIRTLLVDVRNRRAEFGAGGGIVWDSALDEEQSECRTKARILTMAPPPPFQLLETMLWTPADGIRLLALHLDRLRASADYFGFPFDPYRIEHALSSLDESPPRIPAKVRLLLDRNGQTCLESSPLVPLSSAPFLKIGFARNPVDRGDVFLYHKTTHRRVYDERRADCPGLDDVVLFNDAGEATETTIANLAVEIEGSLCTPPVDCGLLPGVARSELLARGVLRERTIPLDFLRRNPRVFIVNSVRGIMPAAIVD